MKRTPDPAADDLVTMQAAEPAPPGEPIPPPAAEDDGEPPPWAEDDGEDDPDELPDPPAELAELAEIASNLGLTLAQAAARLNANPLVDLRRLNIGGANQSNSKG